MSSRARLIAAILGVVLGGFKIAQSQCSTDGPTNGAAQQFVLGGGYVKLPVGAFLLVRKNGEIGAIRIAKIEPGGTEWVGKSTYESFFQSDGSGSLTSANALRKTGEIDIQAPKGPGRGVYIYQPGQNKAVVGKWSFVFINPNVMTMSAITRLQGNGDHGYEFAPTSACKISEIDLSDKRLRWFRYDRNASVTLPIAGLPK